MSTVGCRSSAVWCKNKTTCSSSVGVCTCTFADRDGSRWSYDFEWLAGIEGGRVTRNGSCVDQNCFFDRFATTMCSYLYFVAAGNNILPSFFKMSLTHPFIVDFLLFRLLEIKKKKTYFSFVPIYISNSSKRKKKHRNLIISSKSYP